MWVRPMTREAKGREVWYGRNGEYGERLGEEERRKIQRELPWIGGGRGEAPKAPAPGIESTVAGLGRESQADTDKLMEEALRSARGWATSQSRREAGD
jgi:hypothetical protein